MPLLNIFANNILPILLLSGAGFALGKTLELDPRPLGRVIFYILSPVLVFNLLTSNNLPLDRIAIMMGFTATGTLIIAGLAFLIGKLFRLERGALIIVVLTSMCVNSGNFGLPLVSFAFGQEALAYASIYFVTSTMLFYTLGVIISSLGHLNLKEALLSLLKVPAIYAIILAMVFIRTGWTLPEPILRTLSLAAGGAIPGMLILLGLELQQIEWSRNLRALSIPVFIRLVIGPLVGLGMAALFGLQIPAQQAGITEMGGPTAVMTTVLATEYKLDSTLVTAIVFVSTILSPLTLTPVLYFLGK
jgi:predicted permease